MHKACEQAVEKLGKVLWQSQKLCTRSTQMFKLFCGWTVLYTKTLTGFAQFYSAFTQPKFPNFNLLTWVLCPVSTIPINNTNLIKE
jgi:hypothetical protein